MEAVEEQPVTLGSQQFIDRLNLLCHREIAKRLAREPERVLSIARSNLARWLKAHEGSNTAQALEEWQTLLDSLTVPELIKLITQDSDEGQRLRSSTPFTGLLSPEERKAIYADCEQRAIA